MRAAGDWLLARGPAAVDGMPGRIALASLLGGRLGLRLDWPDSAHVGTRAFDGTWLVFDGDGRLAWFELVTGREGMLSVR